MEAARRKFGCDPFRQARDGQLDRKADAEAGRAAITVDRGEIQVEGPLVVGDQDMMVRPR